MTFNVQKMMSNLFRFVVDIHYSFVNSLSNFLMFETTLAIDMKSVWREYEYLLVVMEAEAWP